MVLADLPVECDEHLQRFLMCEDEVADGACFGLGKRMWPSIGDATWVPGGPALKSGRGRMSAGQNRRNPQALAWVE